MNQTDSTADDEKAQRRFVVQELLKKNSPAATRLAKEIIEAGDLADAQHREETGDASMLLKGLSVLQNLHTERILNQNDFGGKREL